MKQTDLHIQALEVAFRDREYFKVEDLFAFYQSFEPNIAKSTVNWRIHILVQEYIISRIGRGKYRYGNGNIFMPQTTKKAVKIDSFMKTSFPYLNYIIWHINEINSVSQHLINKDTHYVEVEREAI